MPTMKYLASLRRGFVAALFSNVLEIVKLLSTAVFAKKLVCRKARRHDTWMPLIPILKLLPASIITQNVGLTRAA